MFGSREIEVHRVEGDTGHMSVWSDERDPAAGGTAHHYRLTHADGTVCGQIDFQHGPIKEFGVNGASDTALLAVLIDRFEGFQAGPFACDSSQRVLDALRVALAANTERARDRVARGVEGRSQA